VALDGSKISFRLRRGYARKSIKGEKLPTQNPEDLFLLVVSARQGPTVLISQA
jgi:hypothetical protein